MTAPLSVIISFGIYTLAIVLLGLYAKKVGSSTLDDYFLANRSLGGWVVALSASASSESGWIMLGLVGEAFRDGISTLWIIPGCIGGMIFNWLVIAPRMQKLSLKQGSRTLPDVLAMRFEGSQKAIRAISATIVLFFMTMYVAAQMNAAGKAFQSVFGSTYTIGVLFGALIIIVYTATGGFRAVSWTDFAQAILMLMALIVLPLVTLSHVGGFSGMIENLRGQDPMLLSLTAGKSGFVMIGFVIGWLGIGLGYPGLPHVLTRFMSAKDKKAIKLAAPIAIIWSTLVYTGAVLLGLATRAYYVSLEDTETALTVTAVQLLPGIIAGLMLAAVLAAICSTADSQLMEAAKALSNDFYIRLFRTKKGIPPFFINVAAVVVMGCVATGLALTENRTIFDFVLYAWAVLGAAFGPLVIYVLFWKRLTPNGAITGLISGTAGAFIFRHFKADLGGLYELVPAFMVSALLIYIVSLLTQNQLNTTSEEQ